MTLLRRSEIVLVAYFLYAAALARLLPAPKATAQVVFLLNLTIIAGCFLLAYADSLRRRRVLRTVRDWFPLPLLILAYREMGWFAPPRHTYELERSWVVWDRILLYDLGLRAAIESLGPVFPSVLEIAYSLVYAIPYFALATLYAYRRGERADRYLFPLALAVLGAYALFPYFPSEPPRTVFPGQDFPSYSTVFRRFNWALLSGYGIHTSVFPSAHVSAAFASALAMRRVLPEARWVWRVLLAMVILIATATIYGRYHYAVDVLAGAALAVGAVLGACRGQPTLSQA